MRKEIKKTIDDVRDRIDEGAHRTAAEAEKSTRRVAGDEMRPSEKARSTVNQVKHEVQAEIAKGKRTLRDQT